MNTADGSSQIDSINKEKKSGNIDDGNTVKNTENELTNQELDQIFQNITMAGSADSILNISSKENKNQDNDTLSDNQIKLLSKDVRTESQSPNIESESHDEDIFLRWDDDDDDENDANIDQQKINYNISQVEIKETSIQLGSSKSDSSVLSHVSQNNDGNSVTISKVNDINNTVNNDIPEESNDGIIANVIPECDNNINTYDNSGVATENNDQTNVAIKDIQVNNDGLTSDSVENNSCKIDDKSNNLFSSSSNSSDGKICISSSDANCVRINQTADKNDINNGTSSNIINEINVNELNVAGKDNIDKVNDSSALEPDVDSNSSNVTNLKCKENNTNNETSSEVKREPPESHQDSEQEAEPCTENMSFLEKQLKKLAESINAGLFASNVLNDRVVGEPEIKKEVVVETDSNSKKQLSGNDKQLSNDEDDDVVEIIDKCDNYIDLSSQSPTSKESEPLDDSEKLEDDLDNKDLVKQGLFNRHGMRSISGKDYLKYYAIKPDRLRPNVMLEIPMQGLIDVDDIDSETSQDSVATVIEIKDEIKTENLLEDENVVKDSINHNNSKIINESNLEQAKEINEIGIASSTDNIQQMDSNTEIQEQNVGGETNDGVNKHINLDEEVILENDEIKLEAEINETTDMTSAMKNGTIQPSGLDTEMSPDTADQVPEVSDSLGLLAESSRVRREDEDMEEDYDDDDDYDQYDESSNQMTAEHSEDSNAQQSETDSKDQVKTDINELAFTFQESTDKDNATAEKVPVAESVAEVSQIDSAVDEASKDASKETIALEKNEDKAEKDDEITTPAPEKETVEPSNKTVTDADIVTGDEAGAVKTITSTDDKPEEKTLEGTTQSPSKSKKLEIVKQRHVVSIVDLEESSSSDEDVQEQKLPPVRKEKPEDNIELASDIDSPSDVTSVNIPTEIEIMSTACGNTSEIVTKQGEVVIQGVPKPPPQKLARLNTSEVSIKTASASSDSTLVIPETKMSESTQTKPKLGLEIFNLDSDDEDISGTGKGAGGRQKLSALELDAALRSGRCLRRGCGGGVRAAGAGAGAGGAHPHYCDECARAHHRRTQSLVEGIKNMTPLLDLNMEKLSLDLVEISDSDSDNEAQEPKETIGETGATMLEENLADMINSMWRKYKMDANLKDAKVLLDAEMERLDNESKEINKMLNDCQVATDKLRGQLYSTFEPKRQELPAICIYDTNDALFITNEADLQPQGTDVRQGKRRMSAAGLHPAKRPAIPLAYTPLEPETILSHTDQDQGSMLIVGEHSSKYEDDREVSVVQLSAEAAPPDLPPPGEPKRPPLKVGMNVYAMRNAFGSWSKAKILEAIKQPAPSTQFQSFRVKFEHRVKNPCKVLSARCLAYVDAADVRLTIGTRVIALFKDAANQKKTEAFYSGIIAEIPNPVNNYRYLVFFDDGYAQYAAHAHARLVCASAAPVWEEVHPFSRDFVRNYLCAYPERPMVRLHAGQRLNTEWNGKWWDSRVIQVDASLVQVHFEEDNRSEWIYRGSTRLEPLFLELQAAVRHRGRHLPKSKAQLRTNMPYVEYTRSYEQDKTADAQQQEELRRQRAVAKKSTAAALAPAAPAAPPAPPAAAGPAAHAPDAYHSRVVYYTPRNAVRPYKMTPHTCGPKCKRTDVLTLKDLRSYNPLAKPLLSGWERQLVRHKGGAWVLYRAPCGRRVRSARELHRYLRLTHSDAPVDLFDFHPDTHCLAEFVLSKCIVGKKDLSHGKENVPVPCVNSVDNSLPEFCSYNTERTPTAGVPLNLDPEFLCGCDCTDDCQDKTKCACWQLTLEGAKTIGLDEKNVGYVYKRLPDPLPSGIYECNVRCKCKATCLNRVAQHPLQLKLQVFKTPNRGWGIRALNDVPKGAFLCVYAGNLLTDATANLDGLNEGDEYLAELDYIEVVEQMKEGYEDDVPEADKILDKQPSEKKEDKASTEEDLSSEDDDQVSKNEEQDDDFRPGYIGLGVMEFNKRLRKRDKKRGKGEKKGEEAEKEDKETPKEQNADDDCITISDDEEVRQPSRFTAQAGMGANEYVPKYRSVRTHFGRDEACYIMDAKVQGNIGRYLNHSCSPNVFVQNVFVDTHDPRFPWVAFFALSHIRAGTELTWNYNYDVGSVPGKVLYCYCGAPNCRRRLL